MRPDRLSARQDSAPGPGQITWVRRRTTGWEPQRSRCPTKDFTLGGSWHVSDSIGGGGGFDTGAGFNRFVWGHFYRQRYISDNEHSCGGWNYKARYAKSAGDAFWLKSSQEPKQYRRTPKLDPYGRCENDPNGVDYMSPHGGVFHADHGRAETFSFSAAIYNLSVDGSTGYTTHVQIRYRNDSSLGEYVCGNGEMPDSPLLWSNNTAGR